MVSNMDGKDLLQDSGALIQLYEETVASHVLSEVGATRMREVVSERLNERQTRAGVIARAAVQFTTEGGKTGIPEILSREINTMLLAIRDELYRSEGLSRTEKRSLSPYRGRRSRLTSTDTGTDTDTSTVFSPPGGRGY